MDDSTRFAVMYREGREAARQGLREEDNPYPSESREALGWEAGRADMVYSAAHPEWEREGAYNDGIWAFLRGLKFRDNPYFGTADENWRIWRSGWGDAQDEQAQASTDAKVYAVCLAVLAAVAYLMLVFHHALDMTRHEVVVALLVVGWGYSLFYIDTRLEGLGYHRLEVHTVRRVIKRCACAIAVILASVVVSALSTGARGPL